MIQIAALAVLGFLLAVSPCASVAGETGMSYDDAGNPGAPPPHIAPPGSGNMPRPLSTNTTPITPLGGGAQPQAGPPPREVQPGEETPQADDQATRGGTTRPKPGSRLQTGGGDGTQTEDELYVGRKAGGGSVSSGDEDEFEDLEVERRTVQGASRPGERQGSSPTVKKPATLENAQGDAATTNPRGKKAATSVAPVRRNCGTFWTAKVEDPEVDVNPCPKDCERGERQLVKPYKQGNKMIYEARYQCYFRTAAVPQAKAGARLAPDNSPSGRARSVIEKPGAVPVGSVIPASGPWGVLARLKGPGFGGAESVRATWYPNDDASQPPAVSTSVTFRGRHGPDEIDIQMPLDPAKSGARGDFSRGTLHIVLLMPDEKTVIYAGRYAIGTSLARKDLRQAAGADIALKSAAPAADTAQSTGTGEPHPVTGSPQGAQVAGGDIASTQSGIVGLPRQINHPAAAERTISTRNLAGEVTTILGISDVAATSVTVRWKPVPGASGYTLHAAAKGLNHSAKSPEVKQPAGAVPNEMSASLGGLVPGAENIVWVAVSYPNGKGGVSDQKVVSLPPAENPKGFTVTSIGPGAVRLEWQPSPGASHYLVQGSNLPRMQTTNTAVAVSNLKLGTHEWTLMAAYAAGVYNDLNPSRVSATIGPDAAGRARYRITINGFRVDRETMDDPLQRDGKGDEIYFAVYVAEYNSKNGQRLRSDVVRTPVFGDKSGFPAPTRVLAGTAGDTGGIRRGDVYPAANPGVRTRAPSRLDIPYIVWEGELAAGENHLALIPSIWEWDDDAGGFNAWSDSLRSGAPEARYQLQLALQQAVAEKRFTGWPGAHLNPPSFWGRSDAVPSVVGDRLIGLLAPAPGDVRYRYGDRAFAINREYAEAELTKTAYTSLPPGVFSIRFTDDPALGSQFGGDYTLYLQVERLP